MRDLERLEKLVAEFDKYYQFSDDNTKYVKGYKQEAAIKALAEKLGLNKEHINNLLN